MAQRKHRMQVLVDDDVWQALKDAGASRDADRPWPPSRVAASLITKATTGRDWRDGRSDRHAEAVDTA